MLCLASDGLSKEETQICLSEYIKCSIEDDSTPNVRQKYMYLLTKENQTHAI